MSRSTRKTPIFGNTTAESDKEFKQASNRAIRRSRNQGEEPHDKEHGDPWKSAKDGKSYRAKAQKKDMRK
tara:strand:+ start:161 stop:370 length:210 start_codon:yes stop_codon:yes gene_type:complete